MKYLLTIFLFALSFRAGAQEQTCYALEQAAPQMANLDPDPLDGCYPFLVYVEVDYPLHLIAEQRGIAIEDYMDGYLEEERKLFEADGLQASFIVEYWKTPSPYNGTTSSANLNQFIDKINADGGHPGNLAMLLSNLGSGGINYVDVMCNNSFGAGYSSINMNYLPYPQYTWDLMVFAHELGHGLGSPHSHSCSWPGGAIDGCSPFGVEGNCDDPGFPPTGQASIMSYCHLQGSVGIDPAYGFGPLPLALIRNKIASAPCAECEDEPGNPEPDVCDSNRVIIEVLVDLWAQETAWEVTNANGDVVASSAPYPKFPVNHVYADTLCLSDGCYQFIIKDVDGLEGRISGYEGMYIVNGENGELASGQSFEGLETTRFCFGVEPPSGDCDEIEIDSLVPYANQDRRGAATVSNGALTLSGNTWKAMPYEYTVTPRTVLTMEVMIEALGEIHAIGFVDNIQGLSPSSTIRFGGSQRWGIEAEQVALFRWDTIEIPVGQLIPSFDYTYLLFANDYDRPSGDAVTKFRNLELCESGAATAEKSAMITVHGSIADEWHDEEAEMQKWIRDRINAEYRKPYPNPVTDTLNLFTDSDWMLYSIWGVTVRKGTGDKILMEGLDNGAYFVKQNGKTHIIIKN